MSSWFRLCGKVNRLYVCTYLLFLGVLPIYHHRELGRVPCADSGFSLVTYLIHGIGSVRGGGDLVTKSCLTLVTPRTVACRARLSKGFSRKEYWSGLPFPSPGNLPNRGIEPKSPALQADSLLTELQGTPSVVYRYMLIPILQFILPPLPLWYPYICSLWLCLYF